MFVSCMVFSCVARLFRHVCSMYGLFMCSAFVSAACFVMFVSCMVFSCVARLFWLMDFRTRYINMHHAYSSIHLNVFLFCDRHFRCGT